jgi:RNA polymerase sigma-70 factor (ECF subfamily)
MRPTSAALTESPVNARPDTNDREQRVNVLVTQHFDFIWRLLRRLGLSREDADDAAQQVFMTVSNKLERVTPGSERTYLYGIALRVAANLKRKTRRRRENDQPTDSELPEAATEEWAERVESQDLLDRLLGRQPEELRRVLVLAAIEGLELTEIAALEKIPTGTVASRLRRARLQFRQELERLGHANPFRKEKT